jgi:hypothetical protein
MNDYSYKNQTLAGFLNKEMATPFLYLVLSS